MDLKEKIRLQKVERSKFIAATDPQSFDFKLATWMASGLIVPAPGTWGTLAGLFPALFLLLIGGAPLVFLAGIILFFIGLKAVERIEGKLDNHDSSFIVIDEVVAIFLLLAFIPSQHLMFTVPAIFVLFRFFDAKKPWLIGLADKKIKGAMGVMMDDIVAAAFALIVFYIVYIPFVMLGG